jgi:selT/selW/selH-like putative selenoprotein
LADQIKAKYGVDSKLIASGGGVFEVCKNEKLVFSKRATGRFPTPEEVFTHLD